MSPVDTIYNLVKTMPEDEVGTVLAFVEFLLQRQKTPSVEATAGTTELGWKPGFFDQTAGCLGDDPIVRDPQPPLDVREPLM